MAWCSRGVQTLLSVLGSFAAFSLMTIAIGTDYWLYSRAFICNTTNATADETQMQTKRVIADLTHSGLWRICCIEGINKGSCFRINHFPEVNDYDTDSSEYILLSKPNHRLEKDLNCGFCDHFTSSAILTNHVFVSHCGIVRASSLFPILSNILLMFGGLCVGVGRIYSDKNSILLSAGILFVAAGLSNVIGIVVYISSNAGDPSDRKDKDRKNQYNYGWSFYFGALSFIVAESVAVLAVNMYIEKNKETRFRARCDFIKTTSSSSPDSHIPSYRYRRTRSRSRSSSRSTDPSGEPSPVGIKVAGGRGGGGGSGMGWSMGDISLYTLSRDTVKGGSGPAVPYSPERDSGFLQVHNCFQKDLKDGVNRRTTPV